MNPRKVPTNTEDECRCEFGRTSLGVLYGINMGQGRVRITTHPECPVHALCRRFTKQARAAASNGQYLYCNTHGKRDCPGAELSEVLL